MKTRQNKYTRRQVLKGTTVAVGGLIFPLTYTGRSKEFQLWAKDDNKNQRFFGYKPFTQDLYLPPLLNSLPYGTITPTPGQIHARGPIAPTGNCDDVAHGIAPEYGMCDDWNAFSNKPHQKEYLLNIIETTQQFVPGGPDTPIFAYVDGTVNNPVGKTPGPTAVVDYREPVVVRNCNFLTRDRSGVNTTDHDHETSIHLHGTHAPAHSDGYPDFYTLAGEARDYFYPNVAPRRTQPDGKYGFAPSCSGEFDDTWIPSTLWYHDHAMDVTGFNVSRGLAGFYLVKSAREEMLADIGRIPSIDGKDAFGNPLDFGLALSDQLFTRDGSILYDFLDHNGRLGNVFTANGVVQPKHKVQRRKYRIRMLNSSNSRYFEIRLSNKQKMHIIGTDSWLLPYVVEVKSFQLAPGQRHDVIIDFRGSPDEVFIENILVQDDGRGGDEVDPSEQRDQLLKFEVVGGNVNEPRVRKNDTIRGFRGKNDSELGNGEFEFIKRKEIHTTREFRWERSNGAWAVNNRFFNPRRADAVPPLGVGAEKWILENKSGGWWHPIHAHLEGFQIKKVNGRKPRKERRFNSDLVNLEGGDRADVYMKFRSFSGPFVFHCHAIEHEDMRMMGTVDPTPIKSDLDSLDLNPKMDGETRIDPRVSGVVPDCIDLEHDGRIFFDVEGDLDRLEGRGVGFPECDFDITRRGNRGRS